MPRELRERIGSEEQLAHELASLLRAEHKFEVRKVTAAPQRISIESKPPAAAAFQQFKYVERNILKASPRLTSVSAFVNEWDKQQERVVSTHKFIITGEEILQEQEALLQGLRPKVEVHNIRSALHINTEKYKDKHGGQIR